MQIVKTDNTSTSETFAKLIQFYRQLSDLVHPSEYTVSSVSKLLLDVSITSEAKIAQVGKRLTDSYSVNESLTRSLSFLRSFEDLVDATDDYYGAATVGDDEYASFNKNISDILTKTDTIRFNAATILQDILYNLDTSKYTFTKPITESILNTEVSAKTANTLQLDVTSLFNRDSTKSTAQPNKFDSIQFTDILTYLKSTANLFTDSIYSTDSGAAYNQNYFASSYVTPGYTGTITYFGT